MRIKRGNRGGCYEIEYDNCFFFFFWVLYFFCKKMFILVCKYVIWLNYIINLEIK